jgi:hypothetical protein
MRVTQDFDHITNHNNLVILRNMIQIVPDAMVSLEFFQRTC